MVRARTLGVALAASLGLACGCANCPNGGLLYRLTHPFNGRFARRGVEVAPPVEGPVIADPLPLPAPGPGPVIESGPPPLLPPPRPANGGQAQTMPYQP